jgi:hypothetical protein
MKDVKLLDAGPEGSVLFELVMNNKYSNLNGKNILYHPWKSGMLIKRRCYAWWSGWSHI